MLLFARLSTTVALLAVAVMVLFSGSGCASQQHRDTLANLQQSCANGIAWACDNAKIQAEANHQEAMDNAGKAALIPLEVVDIAVVVPLVWLTGGFADDDSNAATPAPPSTSTSTTINPRRTGTGRRPPCTNRTTRAPA